MGWPVKEGDSSNEGEGKVVLFGRWAIGVYMNRPMGIHQEQKQPSANAFGDEPSNGLETEGGGERRGRWTNRMMSRKVPGKGKKTCQANEMVSEPAVKARSV